MTIGECMARIAQEQKIRKRDIRSAVNRCEVMCQRHKEEYLKQFKDFKEGAVIEYEGQLLGTITSLEWSEGFIDLRLFWTDRNGRQHGTINPELSKYRVVK